MQRLLRNPACLAALLVLFVTTTARAQLFLEEGKVVLAVAGGDRTTKSIIIHNTSDKTMNLKAYWEDFQYLPPYDGTKSFVAAGTMPQSAASWVSCSPNELSLPPSGQQKVDCTLAAPSQFAEGHYGVLFFEDANHLKTPEGLNLVTRIGCLFFIEPKDKVRKAAIDKVSLDAGKIAGNFTNQGNIILIPRMTYYITDNSGLMADRGELKNLYVPPQATAEWSVTLPPKLAAGHYSLMLNADLEEGEVVVKEIEIAKDASGQVTLEKVHD